jgi:hypothetical protein
VNRQLVWGWSALAALGGLVACSHEPAAPTPGILNVALSTPNSDDGAVLFTVSGGPVDTLESTGFAVYSARVDPGTLRVIVIGNLASGPIVRIRIPDDGQSSGYTAALDQVSVRATHAQRDPAAYTLSLEAPAQ